MKQHIANSSCPCRADLEVFAVFLCRMSRFHSPYLNTHTFAFIIIVVKCLEMLRLTHKEAKHISKYKTYLRGFIKAEDTRGSKAILENCEQN